jgi:SAM-dependent methyltransferase
LSANRERWDHAARTWSQFEPPLVPSPEDSAVIERVAAALADEHGGLTAVMLGVTPQTASLHWPANVRLTAFDYSSAMIEELWPAPGTPATAQAMQADWSKVPVETGSVDLVAGDHSLGVLSWPDGVEMVLAELRRILKPGGRFVLRSFLRPDQREDLDAIVADLEAGRISSASIARARFCAWRHDRGTQGVSVQEFKELFKHYVPDPQEAVRRYGWNLAPSDIPTKEGNEGRFVYPTLAELRAAIAPFFRELEIVTGSYELAERYPTLVLEPRP